MDAAILTSVFQNRVLFNYALVGSFMLSVADHFQTFAREVRLVWPKQRSIIKFLYLYTRYSPWIYGPMMINKDVAVTLKFGQCAGHTTASSLINMSTIVAAEAIMFVRVYAICGKNRTLLFWLIFQFIAIHVAAYVFLSIFLTSFVFFPTPLPTHMACFPVASDTQKLVYVYVLIIVSEFIIMLISLFGFWKFRAANSQLFKTLRQDGILYFFALVAISFANILFDVAVPDQSLRFILSIPR
ncbi:hypothetical protein FA15DRAFT_462642 [Coprinopsis marcescibilis]|uniref:DUF6533 domain-containing protein n=1 Tax=Coprinopsis marcescibilis TaxID=230819 RepID=A0A5C3KSL1_COPMA|nr:hypothetical protein FA15DRAFT_462642 [Coprinopsis marcescibilis]